MKKKVVSLSTVFGNTKDSRSDIASIGATPMSQWRVTMHDHLGPELLTAPSSPQWVAAVMLGIPKFPVAK